MVKYISRKVEPSICVFDFLGEYILPETIVLKLNTLTTT